MFMIEGRGFLMSFFFKVLVFLVLSHCAQAQSGLFLTGVVQDSASGEFLQGAQLYLEKMDKAAVSNVRGQFRFDNLKTGIHKINASFIGYKTYASNVVIDSTQNILLVQLQPLLSSTSEIVVHGEKESALLLMLPARVDRLQMDQALLTSQSSLNQILDVHSAAFIKSYGPVGQLHTVSIRGMAAEQTQVLLDGIPLNGMQLGSVDLGQFNTANLSEAQIYYGGNMLFGGSGAIGGAINLQSVQPGEHFGYSAQFSYASFQNSDLNIALDLPIGTLRQRLYAARQTGKNDYETTYDTKQVTLQNRDYSRQNLIHQMAYDLNSKWTILSYLSWFRNEAGAATAFLNPLTEQTNKARTENENALAKLALKYRGNSGSFSVSSWLRDELMYYDDPSLIINNQALHSRHQNWEWAAQSNGRYILLQKLLFLSGADWSFQKINSTDAGKHKRSHFASYFMLDWQILELEKLRQKIHLQGKMRWEYDSVYGSVFLPGMGLLYKTKRLELFASAGKNYRSPSFNDLYWVPGGNPNLRPESALNSELGARYQKSFYGVYLEMTAAVYQNRVENQIKWLPVNNVWRPQNILEVSSQGYEFDVSVSDLKAIHKIGVSYNRQNVEKSAPEFIGDKTEGNILPYIPGEQWRFEAQSGYSGFRTGVSAQAMSFRYKSIQNEADQVLAGHTIWRIWAGYQVRIWEHRVGISTSVENVFNAAYQVMPGYPMPPRNYKGGVSIKF